MSSISEEEIARRLGFRIVPWLDGFQIQRLDAAGKVHSVGPAQPYAFYLWQLCLELGRKEEAVPKQPVAPHP